MGRRELNVDIGATTRSCSGESADECGDSIFIRNIGDTFAAFVIDGLGHGAKAHAVSQDAVAWLDACNLDQPLDALLWQLHLDFAGSRGLVASTIRFHGKRSTLEFAGIGNVTTRLVGESNRTLMPSNGIVGYVASRPRLEEIKLTENVVLIMHSDGLPSHVTMDVRDRVRMSGCQATADGIVSRFGKTDDDVACLVADLQI